MLDTPSTLSATTERPGEQQLRTQASSWLKKTRLVDSPSADLREYLFFLLFHKNQSLLEYLQGKTRRGRPVVDTSPALWRALGLGAAEELWPPRLGQLSSRSPSKLSTTTSLHCTLFLLISSALTHCRLAILSAFVMRMSLLTYPRLGRYPSDYHSGPSPLLHCRLCSPDQPAHG